MSHHDYCGRQLNLYRRREVLMRTFPFVPLPYVRHTMQRGRSLFSVYVELSSFERSTTSRNRPYTRLVRKRRVDDHANDLLKGVWVSPAIADSFLKELQAAQSRSGRDAGEWTIRGILKTSNEQLTSGDFSTKTHPVSARKKRLRRGATKRNIPGQGTLWNASAAILTCR